MVAELFVQPAPEMVSVATLQSSDGLLDIIETHAHGSTLSRRPVDVE
jgi:hypothetical protein